MELSDELDDSDELRFLNADIVLEFSDESEDCDEMRFRDAAVVLGRSTSLLSSFSGVNSSVLLDVDGKVVVACVGVARSITGGTSE